MTSDPHESTVSDSPADEDRAKTRTFKIGSQRSGSPPPRIPPRIKAVFTTPEAETAAAKPPAEDNPPLEQSDVPAANAEGDSGAVESPPEEFAPKPAAREAGPGVKRFTPPPRAQEKVPTPNLRQELPPELAAELQAALGDTELSEMMGGESANESKNSPAAVGMEIEPESRQPAKVLHIYRDDVFVELPGRSQGVLPLKQFTEPPVPGAILETVVTRFNAEDGLYELSLPAAAVSVGDWSQVSEGMIVEAQVKGHNKGGLECTLGQLQGFIPASQISNYRVEQFEQFVGQKLVCIVTEANPERRNLVLSRRAMIEREQAAAKEKLLAELAPGEIRDGIVRTVRDFGAFVDLGGVDGLLHVSQISWDRIKHPGDVLTVGQKIRVKIEKIDPDSGKISLTYRELSENPWTNVAAKYPVTSRVKGNVSKLTDFGAFVRLEAGVEGLIHISELAHGRVFRASDIVSEGQEVEVKVLSVDQEQQRIGLSLKALQSRPEPAKKADAEPEPEPEPLPVSKRKTPLKGGLGRVTDGGSGLKW